MLFERRDPCNSLQREALSPAASHIYTFNGYANCYMFMPTAGRPYSTTITSVCLCSSRWACPCRQLAPLQASPRPRPVLHSAERPQLPRVAISLLLPPLLATLQGSLLRQPPATCDAQLVMH